MAHMFYRIADDVNHPTSWWLDDVRLPGHRFDDRVFTWGTHVDAPGRLTIPVRRCGQAMDLSFTLLEVPVASTRLAEIIDRMVPGAIERFPVEVEGHEGKYEVLNVVRVLDAIDRDHSQYVLWRPEDARPDKEGKFRQVQSLVIRDDVRQAAGIFRPRGWTVALIISAQLKNVLEKTGSIGVCFRPLEGGFTAN